MKQQTIPTSQSYQSKVKSLLSLVKPTATILKFSRATQKWCPMAPNPSACPTRVPELTTLSFNILFDRLHKVNQQGSMEHVLNSKQRYAYILAEIGKLRPHVVGLQEVTREFWAMMMLEDWVRDGYWVVDYPTYTQGFGNILMTRMQPICAVPIKVKGLPRVAWTGFLPVVHPQGQTPLILSFSSTHLIAYSEKHKIRSQQLQDLSVQLGPYKAVASDMIIQGDLNFHAEFETQQMLDFGFKDAWLQHYGDLKQFPGYTFDGDHNGLINQLYWGFERRRMRLDRIFYYGTGVQVEDIKIVFDQPMNGEKKEVDKHMFLKGGLLYMSDYFGWNILRKDNKQFLYASDHFGLLATLKIKQDPQ